MSDFDWYTSGFLNPKVANNLPEDEGIGEPTDPLELTIDNDDLVDIIDKRIESYRTYYKEHYDLFKRRKKNETYLFARQLVELETQGDLKDYEGKNIDNVLYEIESTIDAVAMSQLPDLIVTPGSETDEARESSSLLTQVVNSDVRKQENRNVLKLAFKHLPVYFVGVIKCIWNPELANGKGDYMFEVIHPDNIEFDHTATTSDVDRMSFVSQIIDPITVGQVLQKFPKAKEEFIKQLREDGLAAAGEGDPTWKELATPIRIREVWFTDYDKDKEGKIKRVEGVLWKYKKVILDKMKNPYFDYEGSEALFVYENPQLASSKRPLRMEEMQQSMMTGQFPPYVQKETTYHNYFEMPRKPFFFMTFDQWGKQPLDETSRIEQNIRNQDALDTLGRQIQETLKNRGHHVWSKESGLKAADIQKMDHNSPSEDYLVDGKPTDVHEFISPERPDPAEFNEQERVQNRMYAISGSTALRGQVQTDVATTNQIAREANYTRADDLVEATINPASTWIADWSLHMIKTRYTQDHFRYLMGQKGEVLYVKLQQNLVEDGMEVMIKASGTDKIRRQNNAQEDARMQLADPLSYFEDMDYPDPEIRTARIIAFKTNMPLYLSQFVEDAPTATPELAQKLQVLTQQQMQQPMVPGGQPGAPGQPQPGQPQPQQPTPGNTAQVPVSPQAAPPQGSVRNL